MKHALHITFLLLLLFLVSHIFGLYVITYYLDPHHALPLQIEKPKLPEKTSFIPITITMLVATGIAILLVRFHAFGLWKLWFFLSVLFTLTVSFSVFVHEYTALLISLGLTFFKVFKPNVFIHNVTEIFIYGGLASIFVPILTLFTVTILLLIFSVYDMIAVWKTQHMISLAKFQNKAHLFAGLSINYKTADTSRPTQKKISPTNKRSLYRQVPMVERQAILGGGDIGFPLFFSGVILKLYGYGPALLVSCVTALALFLLFYFAQQKKFYPAMPFLTAGCLAGYVLVQVLF